MAIVRPPRKSRNKPEAPHAEMAAVVAHATLVFGAEEIATEWLSRPNRALGNLPPRTLLGDSAGRHRVDVILTRIEHGVIS